VRKSVRRSSRFIDNKGWRFDSAQGFWRWLETGERLDADLVVLGLGVKPATDFIQGIALNDDGSITVDRNLRATDGLYAAGDFARYSYRGQELASSIGL
jgi:pyruvate/2-oxoglutarate dehydrogenase complex dihydrolipoamide dehydrogenase (E3) component